ncbi:gene transfer agent family protein [Brevundimonas aurantiaca]|uniref:gene transfer agent family protein n=1 Tax=Brevundimonas aurantiaca TaxID=74316 RepID=UPI003016EB6A
MSRGAEVTLPFGGEDRLFRMPLGRMRAVQEKCDAGPPELLTRYVAKTWRVDDVREPILQGLIGGGLAPHEAQRLVETAMDGLPMMPFVAIAQAVVLAFLIGADDEEPGEAPAGEASANRPSREESSVSQASTAPAPSSD